MTIDSQPVPQVEGQETDPEISLRRRFLNRNTLLSFVVAIAILLVGVKFGLSKLDVELAQIWSQIRHANPVLYLLAFLVYYITFPIRGFRWRLLLENARINGSKASAPMPSFFTLGEIILMGWFANCVVPAKLGDAYRAYLLKKDMHASFSRTMGTVMAERVIDVIVVFALLIVAAIGALSGTHSTVAFSIIGVGFAFVFILCLGLVIMGRFGPVIQGRLPARFRGIYERFHEGTLQSFRQLPLVAALTVIVWLLEAGRLWLVAGSLGVSLSVAMVIFVALAHSLITALPVTPGGLGLVELGVTGLLMLSVSPDSALAVTVLDRGVAYWSIVLVGLLVFLIGRRR